MISCFFRNLLQAFPFCAHDKNAKPALYVLVSVLLSRRLYFQQLALGYRVGFCHLSSPSTLYHILNYIGQFGEKIAPEFGNIYIGSIRRAISNALCFSPSMIPSSTICQIASHILVFSPSKHLSIAFTAWLFCSILQLPVSSASLYQQSAP